MVSWPSHAQIVAMEATSMRRSILDGKQHTACWIRMAACMRWQQVHRWRQQQEE